MPEDATPPRSEAKDDTPEPSTPKGSRISLLFKGKWLGRGVVILIVFLVILQAVCWIHYQVNSPSPRPQSPEIALGEYGFTTDPSSGGRISQARFSLHITLLKGLEKKGRKKLNSHKFRVQQNVEQLLRQIHAGDFEDPVLGGLKIQIRDKVNRAIGKRVVADVIITDLKLTLPKPSDHQALAENSPVTEPPDVVKNQTLPSPVLPGH